MTDRLGMTHPSDSLTPEPNDLDNWQPDTIAAPSLAGPVTERKCRRHLWRELVILPGNPEYEMRGVWECSRCGTLKDEQRSRRGRSSRRLGNDGERRSEKRYGWRKTGEFGGIDDLVGALAVVQQKTSRQAPPIRWKGIFARLQERAAGRVPLILFSFVKQGLPTEDFILIRGSDWLSLFGRDDGENG